MEGKSVFSQLASLSEEALAKLASSDFAKGAQQIRDRVERLVKSVAELDDRLEALEKRVSALEPKSAVPAKKTGSSAAKKATPSAAKKKTATAAEPRTTTGKSSES